MKSLFFILFFSDVSEVERWVVGCDGVLVCQAGMSASFFNSYPPTITITVHDITVAHARDNLSHEQTSQVTIL